MDRRTGRRDVTEIMLKTALNTTINHKPRQRVFQGFSSDSLYLECSKTFRIESIRLIDTGIHIIHNSR